MLVRGLLVPDWTTHVERYSILNWHSSRQWPKVVEHIIKSNSRCYQYWNSKFNFWIVNVWRSPYYENISNLIWRRACRKWDYLFYLFVDNTLCIYTHRYGETGTQNLSLAYRISNEYVNKISVFAFFSRSQYECGGCADDIIIHRVRVVSDKNQHLLPSISRNMNQDNPFQNKKIWSGGEMKAVISITVNQT